MSDTEVLVPRLENADPSRIARGRWLLWTLNVAIFVLALAAAVLNLVAERTDRLPVQGIRFVVTVALWMGVFTGVPIARWVAVVSFALAGGWAVVSANRGQVDEIIVNLAMAAAYLSTAGALLWSKSAETYLHWRRRGRAAGRPR